MKIDNCKLKITRVLAVDPGYERLGIAVLEKTEAGKSASAEGFGETRGQLVYSECFRTSPKTDHSKRLATIGQKIAEVILKYKPTECAIENLFLQSNQKTAMAVSEAKGVILSEVAKAGISVFEYTPPQVKVATTGYGRSDKRQVTGMIKRLVVIDKKIKFDDEYDAIAVGVTHFASRRN